MYNAIKPHSMSLKYPKLWLKYKDTLKTINIELCNELLEKSHFRSTLDFQGSIPYIII